jgi:hypothetical protein
MPVSLREFAFIELTVYELEEGCALSRVSREPAVQNFSHSSRFRTNLYVFYNETAI